MKKQILVGGLALVLIAIAVFFPSGSNKGGVNSDSTQVIGFYNVENLFDTIHDKGKSDQQFLPDGENNWTQDKYEKKLANIAQVIASMAEENGQFHTVLGLAEVENHHVLEDLVLEPSIVSADYQIVHHEGPDGRGIDCALLYRPDQFQLLESKSIHYDFNSSIEFEYNEQEKKSFRTRDVLCVRGTIGDDMFAFFVGHLPSRNGDKAMDLRARGAEIIYENAMALMEKYPDIKIVVMGDMNDNPGDESMDVYLHGKENLEDVTNQDFYSPFYSMFRHGYGSEEYHGSWNLFDQIMVNYNMIGDADGYTIDKITEGKYYGRVYNADFLTQQSGRYKGTPLRTFSGGEFINGYSDHYPTFIRISKK